MENRKLEKIEKDINIDLYGHEEDDLKNLKDIKEIKDRLEKVKINITNNKSGGILEFLSNLDYSKNKILMNRKDPSKKVNNKALIDVLSKQKWDFLFNQEQERIRRYSDYRILYSYITDLSLCLDSYVDMIISPDEITNSSLNIHYKHRSINELSSENEVYSKIKKLISTYKLTKKSKKIIRDTAILGDNFVGVFRYDKEFRRLLLKENDEKVKFDYKEDIIFNENIISESSDFKMLEETFKKENEKEEAKKFSSEISDTLNRNVSAKSFQSFLKTKPSDIKNIKNIKGNIIKFFKPEDIVKIELDGINLGYVYSHKEIQTQPTDYAASVSDVFNSRTDLEDSNQKLIREKLIVDIFSKGIEKKLNVDFLSKNENFKNFIYIILKNKDLLNKKVSFTYIPPENMVHFYIDENEIYGTSKLAKSLFLGKLYLSSLITQQMEKVSRGRDKRIFYVETGVDDDIEGVIQEVVRNVKGKDIQASTLSDITSILNTVGIFEDYYMPMIDGEKPIEMDTISGTDSSSDEEWLNFLLKGIIKGTGFPANYIDTANEVDFARTVVMQNALFVKMLVSDQEEFSESLTLFFRKLYFNEYANSENEEEIKNEAEEIEIYFPKPKSLSLSNLNDQINNASQTVDFLTNTYINENSQDPNNSDLKLIVKRRIAQELLPSIDWAKIEQIFIDSKKELKKQLLDDKTKPTDSSEEMNDSDMGY